MCPSANGFDTVLFLFEKTRDVSERNEFNSSVTHAKPG